jgi:hypothetical protein
MPSPRALVAVWVFQKMAPVFVSGRSEGLKKGQRQKDSAPERRNPMASH